MDIIHKLGNIRHRALVAMLFMVVAMVAAASHPLDIPGASTTHVGIYIEDLKTGEILADVNSTDFFVPASVMKSVTSATVLSELVSDGRFVTPVEVVGTVTDGVLDGNLVVRTVGDPTIESAHFKNNLGFADSIAAGVVRAGISRITGSVVIDESRFCDASVPDGWQSGDLDTYYGTLVHGCNYRGNSKGKVAVKNPAKQMVTEIEKALATAGVTLDNQPSDHQGAQRAVTVYAHKSPRVDEILRSLMVRSDNMMAEGMLRALEPGRKRDAALAYEKSVLTDRGLDFDGIVIRDGSGLSRKDRLSPQFMASLYRNMYRSPLCREYVALFPKAGKEGTMRNFLKDTRLEGRLAMKTGSMTGVQGFGGYLLDDAGMPTHIVVVFVNDFTCNRDALKKTIGNFLLETLP